MKKVNLEKRRKHYEFFKNLSNAMYSMNVRIDVTNIVNYTKEKDLSFFTSMLYIVTKSLNSVDEMRMRYVDDEPVIYDVINPAYTVRALDNQYENIGHKYCDDFKEFYKTSREMIERTANGEVLCESYRKVYDEYFITSTKEIDFLSVTQPIADEKSLQCIPRICWGKYTDNNGKLELTLNITVNHMFVDGYPLSKAFNEIQEALNNPEEYLKI